MTKKQQILETVTVLFLNNGVQETFISTIIEKSGVSNGTLFYHFKTKDDLILAVYQQIKDQSSHYFLTSISESDDFDQFLYKYWLNNVNWCLTNPKHYRFIRLYSSYPIILEQYQTNHSTELFLQRIDNHISNKLTSIDNRYLYFESFVHIRDSLISYIEKQQIKDDALITSLSCEHFERLQQFLN